MNTLQKNLSQDTIAPLPAGPWQTGRTWQGVFLVVAAAVVMTVGLIGCMAQGDDSGGYDVSMAVGNSYAVIDPRQLNSSLSDNALERMFLAYNDLPWEQLADGIDPNQIDIEVVLGETTPQNRDMQAAPAVLETPQQAEAIKKYLQARWLLRNGQVSQALAAAQQGLANDSNSADLWLLVSKAQYGLGRSRAGTQSSRMALSINPDLFEAWHRLGVESLSAANFAHAAVYLRRGLLCSDVGPGNPAAVFLEIQLASTLDELGYLNAANTAYQRCYEALTEQAGYSQADASMSQFIRQIHVPLFAMATNYVHMGRIAAAAKIVDQIFGLVPAEIDAMEAFTTLLFSQRITLPRRFAEVRALCSYLLSDGRDETLVVGWFYKASQAMAKYEDYLIELEDWHEQTLIGDRQYAYGLRLADLLDESQEILEGLAAEEDTLVLRDLAQVYAAQGMDEKMLAAYGDYLTASPGAVDDVLAKLSQWIVRDGDIAEKVSLWRDRLDSPGSVFLLGYLAQRTEQPGVAEGYYRYSAEQFAPARAHLIELLLDTQRYEEALSLIENDINDGNGELLWYAGRACLGLDRPEEAARYYQQVIEQQPDNVRAYTALAEVLREQGQLQQAEQILLQVLARWPAEMEIHEQLILLYCVWAADSPGSDTAGAAERRAREMLQQWMTQLAGRPVRADGLDRLSSRGDEAMVPELEALAQRYPAACVVPLVLSEYYSRTNRQEQAFTVIEDALAADSEDEKLLARGVALAGQLGRYAEAGDYAMTLWAVKEHTVDELFDCMAVLRRAGRSDEAVELLLSWYESDEDCEKMLAIEAQAELRRVFMISRRFDEAVELLWRWYECRLAEGAETDQAGARASSPEAIANGDIGSQQAERLLWENLIWALTEAGQYDRAASLLPQLYERFDIEDSPSAMFLVRSLWVRRQFEQCRSVLEQLAQLNEDSLAVRTELYLTMIDQGQFEQAVEAAEGWLAGEPDSTERRWLAAEVMLEGGDLDGAITFLEGLLDRGEGDETLESLLVETLIRAQQFDRAEDVLTDGGLDDMLSGMRFEQMLRVYIAGGHCDAAERHFETVASNLPAEQYSQARVELLSLCGRTEEAVEVMGSLLTDEPGNDQLRLYYSTLLGRAGQTDRSIAELEAVFAKDRTSSLMLNNLGYSLLENGSDVERGGELILQSFYLEPMSAATQDSVGWYYYLSGDGEVSLGYLFDAAANMPGRDAEVFEHLGDVVNSLGRVAEAVWYWRIAENDLAKRAMTERYMEDALERVRGKITAAEDSES